VSDGTSRAAAHLPSVDRVLGWPAVAALIASHGRQPVVDAVRAELAMRRARRGNGGSAPSEAGGMGQPDADAVADAGAGQQEVDVAADAAAGPAGDPSIAGAVAARLDRARTPSLRKVFNLTGTVLHTNLGRAPLPQQALDAIAAAAAGASNLEYDLASGQRGERDDHVEPWLCRLTGAEAATVVNNNAAALMLVLNTFALRKEVPVSRGELIEIGGGFRLPSVMARAGCRLIEVGTTNRTHIADYAEAIGPRTALLLKVHASNYEVRGFTSAPAERALAALADAHDLPFVVDLGSGALVDLARFGLPHEPTPAEALAAGADLVLFSGDKLLGGPQAGIVVGRADLVAALRKNPMKRALRCDKLTLAALAAVLPLYADPARLPEQLPVLRWLTRPAAEIEAAAARLAPPLGRWLHGRADVDVVAVQSQIGSGSLPIDLLPSHALRIVPHGKRATGRALTELAGALRSRPVPVIGRIANGALLLDLRCLCGDAEEAAFRALFAEPAWSPDNPPPRDHRRADAIEAPAPARRPT
jgi:L-seryl-tRNA(Ser) seleniumtransferase